MKSYQVKFKLEVSGKEFGDVFVWNAGISLDYANSIVDEILEFRKTGKKSGILLHIERELAGTFKQTSSSIVEIRAVSDDRVRIEGGAYEMMRKLKIKRESNV